MSLKHAFLNNNLKQYKILVVEDNPLIQFALKSMLTQLKYDFDLAATGFEAIKLAKKTSDYSIVFMDIDLPDMSGVEVTQMLLSMETTKHVPVVAMTSHTEQEYRLRCYSIGMVGYYGKPKTVEDIQSMVQRHVLTKPQNFITKQSLESEAFFYKEESTVLLN
jgi:CheY-like chemotaxis protein